MALTKITTDSIDLSLDTTGLKIPKGTTSERIPIGIPLEYLVVAGGGGASNGGGGAGGLLTNHGGIKLSVNEGTNLTLTVGLGGTGAAQGTAEGTQGGDSVFSSITATGGGGGIRQYDGPTTNADGGSGGGGGGYPTTRKGSGNTPSTTPSQGNDGGGGAYGSNYSGGGGGGAGAAGTAGVGTTAGSGGIGATTTIINTTLAGTYNVGEVDSGSLYFAGGGAGGSKNDTASYSPGTGGLGGGADTPASQPNDGQDGTANTGGGASGATYQGYASSSQLGGDGGSGVIILKTTGIVSTTFSAGCTVNGTSGAQTTNGDTSTGNSIFIITVAGVSDTITFPPPSSVPTVGLTRENTTTGKMEIYTGTKGWRALQQTGQDVGVVPTNNFNTVLYTGNGTTQSITGLNFQPDLTWVKDRDVAHDNLLVDSVNGAGSVKGLVSNTAYVEGAYTATDGYISSLNSNGFTVSTGSSSANYTNATPNDYVSWNWKAGGAAVQNNEGTINGTDCMVSANPDAGFSIIKWTGSTSGSSESVGHGLGKAPELVILKNIDAVDAWYTYAEGATGNNQYLKLNTTDAVFTALSDSWGAGPTSSLMGLRPGTFSGSSSYNIIMYCWTSIPGYSLIGNYTGTGSATNNPIIYTGFQPGFIMVKRTDSTGDWNIVDNKRSTSNPRDLELFANTYAVEATSNYINFNADGFQIITTDTDWNAAGGKYLFMCFAS